MMSVWLFENKSLTDSLKNPQKTVYLFQATTVLLYLLQMFSAVKILIQKNIYFTVYLDSAYFLIYAKKKAKVKYSQEHK